VTDFETEELSGKHLVSGRGLRADVASGLRWGAFDQVVQTVIRLAVALVLTRLIAPEDFGVMAIAVVVVNFCGVLTGFGLGDALVQRAEITAVHVRSAFTASAVVGVVLGAATALAASTIASFFDEPEARNVLIALSTLMIFQGLERTPNDMLARALRFRPFYLSSTVAAMCGSVVGLTAAFAGADVWALVLMAASESAVACILAWVFAIRAGVWRPRVGLRWQPLRELLGFSSFITADRAVGFALDNGDNLLVGRFLGAQPLGYYSLAYRVILVPVQRVAKLMSRAAFPALSRVQDDVVRLREGFQQANRYVALTCMPIMVGVAVTAPDLVPVVFGDRWRPATTSLVLLALSGPALLVTNLSGTLYRSAGRPQWGLARTFVAALFYLPAFAIGAQHGIAGVAAGFTIASYVALPLDIWLSARATELPPWRIVENVAPVAFAVAVMAGACRLTAVLMDSAGEAIRLTVLVAVGVLTYLAVCALLLRDTMRRAWHDVTRRS
jgi:O-antigen/teichoic acid export membrane protein